MTKILMNNDLLAYQEGIKASLRQVIQYQFIGGIDQAQRSKPPLAREDLLPPPAIKVIYLGGYQGEANDFIGIVATHDFGIHSMHISIRDMEGNLIERGQVHPIPGNPDCWSYFPSVPVAAGSPVMVEISAMDRMGGVGSWSKRKTMGEDEW